MLLKPIVYFITIAEIFIKDAYSLEGTLWPT